MRLPNTVTQFLQDHSVHFEIYSHPSARNLGELVAHAKVPRQQVAKVYLLEDAAGFAVAVVPCDRSVDLDGLNQTTQRGFRLADDIAIESLFADCEKGSMPPFGEAYGLEAYLDNQLADVPYVYFEGGIHDKLLGVNGREFRLLMQAAQLGEIAKAISDTGTNQVTSTSSSQETSSGGLCDKYMPCEDIRKRLDQIYSLPPMPQVAVRILQIRDNPDASVDELASCVELDPSLAAQVVRYARSPFFGYRGEIDSIRDAIHKVLGFNMVTSIAIGLASGKSFKNPADGPLGLNDFWRQAAYSAAIAQELGRTMPKSERPNLGLAYLAGLLHNFGFLLLGHLFKPEFYLLNKMVGANPDTPVIELEQQVLGMGDAQHVISMGHARLGAWLMHSWNMPEEVVVTLAEHHIEGYDGPHHVYANLVLLADRLIKSQGFGDGDSEELPVAVLERLGLTEDQVRDVFEKVLGGSETLDKIASQLAA